MPNMQAAERIAKENVEKIILSHIHMYIRDVDTKAPSNHESLIELLRNRANKNELWLIATIQDHLGDNDFRIWVEEILGKSGFISKREW